MIQTTTTKSTLNIDPLNQLPQNNYRSLNDPMLTQPYKVEASPSYSASYSSDKLNNVHQNPSFTDYDDGIYQPTKRLKAYGKEYNMLQNNIQPHPMIDYSSGNSQLDLNYLKLQNTLLPYQTTVFNAAPTLQIPANQPVSSQYLNMALFQNVYNNALVEAEAIRRYNELQELVRLQNINNSLMPGNLNNWMMLSLYEKQKKDYYNFYLLKEAQQQLGTALMNLKSNQIPSQTIDAHKNYEKKNQDVILIDEDESVQNTTLQNITSKIENQTEQIPEKAIIEKQTELKQENNVKFSEKSAKKEKIIHGMRIGSAHQTNILPYALNHRKRKVSKVLKPVWKPDVIDNAELEQYFAVMEKTVGDKIMNQENAVKILVKFGMDLEAVKNEIRKNLSFYRNYFKTSPRVLRNKQSLA